MFPLELRSLPEDERVLEGAAWGLRWSEWDRVCREHVRSIQREGDSTETFGLTLTAIIATAFIEATKGAVFLPLAVVMVIDGDFCTVNSTSGLIRTAVLSSNVPSGGDRITRPPSGVRR